ncbi:MAG: ABC transporter ATP-binding protein, partial [Acidimicrobiia bacterium]|nr:ABC transporter ATP-binding protein [Acidimicrobiia bacterium]
MSAVDIRGLGKVFNQGAANQVDALVDVDLSIASGEFVSL